MQRLGIANHERAHWLAGDPMVAEHVAVRLAIDSKPYAPTMFTSNDEGTIYASSKAKPGARTPGDPVYVPEVRPLKWHLKAKKAASFAPKHQTPKRVPKDPAPQNPAPSQAPQPLDPAPGKPMPQRPSPSYIPTPPTVSEYEPVDLGRGQIVWQKVQGPDAKNQQKDAKKRTQSPLRVNKKDSGKQSKSPPSTSEDSAPESPPLKKQKQSKERSKSPPSTSEDSAPESPPLKKQKKAEKKVTPLPSTSDDSASESPPPKKKQKKAEKKAKPLSSTSDDSASESPPPKKKKSKKSKHSHDPDAGHSHQPAVVDHLAAIAQLAEAQAAHRQDLIMQAAITNARLASVQKRNRR